ncbi:MAG: hypothetical protein KatS3mg040_0411 [Candidatus Kapaibacterium sp.]|nr:MAG: hypothetical protein KatS3mg040_0411 [Candidatus Kapabacteria bacterium]
MGKTMKTLGAVLALMVVWIGCSDSPTEYVAEEFTVSQIARQPGYAWFLQEKDSYQPDPALVAQIQAKLGTLDSCYLFVNPSCSCNGTQKHFPHFVRCMELAGFSSSKIAIISMRTASTKHAHMARFHVQRLPTFFLVLSGGGTRTIEPPDDPNARIEELIVQALNGQ